MHFLPDVYVPCEVCHGKRFNSETLEIAYKGKNIAQVLDMTVEEGLMFFENIPRIKRQLQTLGSLIHQARTACNYAFGTRGSAHQALHGTQQKEHGKDALYP